jgi:hypothetical protein
LECVSLTEIARVCLSQSSFPFLFCSMICMLYRMLLLSSNGKDEVGGTCSTN